ncbi:MAG: FAD:protein FMN transferase [Actinomycetia bacterium]|nr:FAD:protein FMN transferase [Actinomycetes bacterium]
MGPSRNDGEVLDGWAHGASGSVVRGGHLVHVEHIWGTVITINVSGTEGREDHALCAINRCREFFVLVDQTFSTYKPTTEVALYRAGLQRPGQQSDDFEEVMLACCEVRELTEGAFDPWAVPGGYDPSGYVKGWAAGRASERLVTAGFSDHLVNAGGDIAASGDELPGSGKGWPTGILNPHAPSEVIEVTDLRNESMATSGRYERGDHVVDPSTGRMAIDVDSETVVGPDPGVADALASAALVRGTASVAWFDSLGPDWSLYLVIGEAARTYGRAFD